MGTHRSLRNLVVLAFAAGASACTSSGEKVELSKRATNEIPKVPVPPEHGPKLGAIADRTPVLERPAPGAKPIGYLHAGARVARAEQPYTREGCAKGFFPVRPAGFVCAEGSATVDLSHPTLAAMAIQPLLDQPLPYTYARTTKETPLFERDPKRDGAVRELGKLKRRAGMAVVGSWNAATPDGESERLALLTSGRFVKAADLEASEPSEWKGVELGEKRSLPIGFVVKRGVRRFKLDRDEAKNDRELDYHEVLSLTGRYRTSRGEKFWALDDGTWVRHRDVTVVLPRSNFPEFVTEGQKWIDVSVITQTLLAYEGKKPFFVTLVSVARNPAPGADEPVPDDEPSESLAPASGLGTFEVAAKHVTLVGADPFAARENYPLYDLPWTLELSSGRLVYGAYWHDRFGIEHGPGGLGLSPADAVRIFQWATPTLPDGWHSSTHLGKEAKTIVRLRK